MNSFCLTEKGSKIYADHFGAVVTDRMFRVKNKLYCAKRSGALYRNGLYTLKSGKKIYALLSGVLMEDEVFTVNGDRYYADENGYLVSSRWVTVGDYRYYCSASRKITKVEHI